MFGIFGIPVADDHRRAAHRDIFVLLLRDVVQHLVDVDDVAIVSFTAIHSVQSAEMDHGVVDIVVGMLILAAHRIGIVDAAHGQFLAEIGKGDLLAGRNVFRYTKILSGDSASVQMSYRKSKAS